MGGVWFLQSPGIEKYTGLCLAVHSSSKVNTHQHSWIPSALSIWISPALFDAVDAHLFILSTDCLALHSFHPTLLLSPPLPRDTDGSTLTPSLQLWWSWREIDEALLHYSLALMWVASVKVLGGGGEKVMEQQLGCRQSSIWNSLTSLCISHRTASCTTAKLAQWRWLAPSCCVCVCSRHMTGRRTVVKQAKYRATILVSPRRVGLYK